MPAVRADRSPQHQRRARDLVALTLAVALLGLVGCDTKTAPVAPAPRTAVDGATIEAQTLVDRLVRAARARDRAAFDAEVSRRDPSFADRARLLFTNLGEVPWQSLELRVQARTAPVPSRLRGILGPDAASRPATVRWRLAGETASAEHTVWLTFAAQDGRLRLAGTDPPQGTDTPADTTAPQPIWWTGPVRVASSAGVTVLTGSGQSPRVWLDRAVRAADEVRHRVSAGAAGHWAGDLVVEVPASRPAFEAVLGADPGSYAGIAAVTLAEGPGHAALRVVVNPEVTRTLAPLGVAIVLTHETVHVATRSTDSAAPTWMVEGFADEVAMTANPGAAAGAAAPLLERVRANGPPTALPGDEEVLAGAGNLDVSYAEAWLACRYVSRTWSPQALQRLYTALDHGRSLDEAVAATLGGDGASFTRGWRAFLARQARG